MGLRTNLHTVLVNMLGSSNVYFQPPENIKLKYPCIVYERNSMDTRFADNKPYAHKLRYKIIVIDKDPDTKIIDRIKTLPMCIYDNHYVTDNLNHDVFFIYY